MPSVLFTPKFIPTYKWWAYQVLNGQRAHTSPLQATGKFQKERDRMHKRLLHYGLKDRDVVGDGNCQMRAISYQLYGTEDNHAQVRLSFPCFLRILEGISCL